MLTCVPSQADADGSSSESGSPLPTSDNIQPGSSTNTISAVGATNSPNPSSGNPMSSERHLAISAVGVY